MNRKTPSQDAFRSWAKHRIKIDKTKSLKGLAARFGLHPAQITQMLKPGGRRITVDDGKVILEYIGGESPPPEVLAGVFGTVQRFVPPPEQLETGARGMISARKVRIVAVLAAETWKDKEIEAARLAAANVQVPELIDPQFEGLEQYGVWIEHMRVYGLCVPYFSYRTQPMAGDLVHVRRTNAAGLIEDSMRKVTRKGAKVQLVTPNGVPKGIDKAIPYPSEKDGETTEIVGYILASVVKHY